MQVKVCNSNWLDKLAAVANGGVAALPDFLGGEKPQVRPTLLLIPCQSSATPSQRSDACSDTIHLTVVCYMGFGILPQDEHMVCPAMKVAQVRELVSKNTVSQCGWYQAGSCLWIGTRKVLFDCVLSCAGKR